MRAPQEVLDALADAETLLVNADGPCGCNSDGRGEGWSRPHYHKGRLSTAYSLGFMAASLVNEDPRDLMMGQDPAVLARYAARAAFRAVPGLRG